jgi:hypothetical protein
MFDHHFLAQRTIIANESIIEKIVLVLTSCDYISKQRPSEHLIDIHGTSGRTSEKSK